MPSGGNTVADAGVSRDRPRRLLSDLDTILVVDPSKLMREVLARVLAPHVENIHVASSCEIAREHLVGSRVPSMVLCAADLPDGDGLSLLTCFEQRAPQTCFVLLASKWCDEDAEQALAAGAACVLSKPVRMQEIARAWTDFRRMLTVRDERVSPRAYVQVVESTGERLVSWRVRNLSVSGAFIETRGPLPLELRLSLEIMSGRRTIRLEAEVVRVQEPSWVSPGGVGVRFCDPGSEARAALVELIAHVRRAESLIAAMLDAD